MRQEILIELIYVLKCDIDPSITYVVNLESYHEDSENYKVFIYVYGSESNYICTIDDTHDLVVGSEEFYNIVDIMKVKLLI